MFVRGSRKLSETALKENEKSFWKSKAGDWLRRVLPTSRVLLGNSVMKVTFGRGVPRLESEGTEGRQLGR